MLMIMTFGLTTRSRALRAFPKAGAGAAITAPAPTARAATAFRAESIFFASVGKLWQGEI